MSPASQARLNGIARLARERGWMLMLESDISRPPGGWRGDGVIVAMKDNAPELAAFVRELTGVGIPVVNASGRYDGVRIPAVCGDDWKIGELAAEHFAERRFENTAWFSTEWGQIHERRFAAFCRFWRASAPNAAMPLRLVWSETSPSRPPADWSKFSSWLGDAIDSAQKPLGVFAYSDYDATRVIAICRERGLDVPGEVAVLGVDNNPIICENQIVPISSVNHDLEQIGHDAAAMLDSLMNGAEPPAGPVLVMPRGITLRRSTNTMAVNHPVLRSAMACIASHLAEPIGAPQIADAVGVSRLRLDRLFARELGTSVGREVMHQRLIKAKLLLRGSELPLSQIARLTGFCDAAYLANVFRREFGITPGIWRKS